LSPPFGGSVAGPALRRPVARGARESAPKMTALHLRYFEKLKTE
jgi:hypothetical protein